MPTLIILTTWLKLAWRWDGVAKQLHEFYLELIEAQNLELLNKSLKNSIQPIKA